MGKALLIAEKPSAARAFAKALGGMQGTYQGQPYIIVPARGHMYEFAKPDAQVKESLVKQYKSWNLDNLPWNPQDFSWKRVPQKDTSAALKAIKDAARDCDEIVCGTDVDPTGEGFLIFSEIIDELSLRGGRRKFSRMYHMDESVKEVKRAFENRKAIPDLDKHDEQMMAWYRTRWDFLSMQWSRVATKCGDGTSVLRNGRLKSAMVLIVGDRLKAIAEYVDTPYWENRFRDENGVVYVNPEEPRFPSAGDIPQGYHDSAVVCDSKTDKKTAPPKLLDLAGLSSRLPAFAPKTLLKTYQKLYESQIVSYPRTEDKTITPEQFNELLPKIDAIADLVGADKSMLTHRSPRSTHVKEGGAHGANRPGPNVPKALDDLKQYGPGAVEIYVTLAKNYLAMLAEDYEYEQQKGHVKDFPKFVGTANVPKFMGWKGIFSTDDDDDDDSVNTKGLGTMASPFAYEGHTPKPGHPTRKWLMKQLEKHDVGTGATRLSTYADVTSTSAKYPLLVEKRGRISMADCGDMSYLLLPGTHIGDIKLTERVQSEMKQVAKGQADPDVLLGKIADMVREDIVVMQKNGEDMRHKLNVTLKGAAAPRIKCMWEGQEMSYRADIFGHTFTDDENRILQSGGTIRLDDCVSRSGTEFACTGKLFVDPKYGLCFKPDFNVDKVICTWNGQEMSYRNSFCGHMFTDDENARLQAGESIELTDCVGKSGNTFRCSGQLGIDPKFGLCFQPVFENDGKVGGVYTGRGKRKNTNVRFKSEFGGHTFTDDEIAELLAGHEIQFEAMSKKGKPYICKGKLAENTFNGRKYFGFKPDFS